jgi:hypothetical protein
MYKVFPVVLSTVSYKPHFFLLPKPHHAFNSQRRRPSRQHALAPTAHRHRLHEIRPLTRTACSTAKSRITQLLLTLSRSSCHSPHNSAQEDHLLPALARQRPSSHWCLHERHVAARFYLAIAPAMLAFGNAFATEEERNLEFSRRNREILQRARGGH